MTSTMSALCYPLLSNAALYCLWFNQAACFPCWHRAAFCQQKCCFHA